MSAFYQEGGGGGGGPPPAARPPARTLIDIIPFVLASFGSLVLSYVTTASGGAASPGLGGQRTPRGKGKGKEKERGKRPYDVNI